MLRDAITDFASIFLWVAMPIIVALGLVYAWFAFVFEPNSRARCAAHHGTWASAQDTGSLTACESIDGEHALFWIQPNTGLVLVQRDNSPFCTDPE